MKNMSQQIYFIFILLVIFQLKHFVADFLLQTQWMLNKFKLEWDFFFPLLAHVAVHAAFTLIVCLIINPYMWWLALFDAFVHFIMDRIKAGPKYLGRFKALSGDEYKRAYDTIRNAKDPMAIKRSKSKIFDNKIFWISLGLDQKVHHLTHYFIIFILVCA